MEECFVLVFLWKQKKFVIFNGFLRHLKLKFWKKIFDQDDK